MTVAEQLLANMGADETSAASDQKIHQKSAGISPEFEKEVKDGRSRGAGSGGDRWSVNVKSVLTLRADP